MRSRGQIALASAMAWYRAQHALQTARPYRLKHLRKCGFAKRADRQARERDAKLYSRNDAVQIAEQVLLPRAPAHSPSRPTAERVTNRTATRENSVAAKKPFSATKPGRQSGARQA